jgi:hypothetical protein
LAAKTDIIDDSLLLILCNLLKTLACSKIPAYKLIRHKLFERKAVEFYFSVIVARLCRNFSPKSQHLPKPLLIHPDLGDVSVQFEGFGAKFGFHQSLFQ